jgi:hypothetical protein
MIGMVSGLMLYSKLKTWTTWTEAADGPPPELGMLGLSDMGLERDAASCAAFSAQ